MPLDLFEVLNKALLVVNSGTVAIEMDPENVMLTVTSGTPSRRNELRSKVAPATVFVIVISRPPPVRDFENPFPGQ